MALLLSQMTQTLSLLLTKETQLLEQTVDDLGLSPAVLQLLTCSLESFLSVDTSILDGQPTSGKLALEAILGSSQISAGLPIADHSFFELL